MIENSVKINPIAVLVLKDFSVDSMCSPIFKLLPFMTKSESLELVDYPIIFIYGASKRLLLFRIIGNG